MDFCRGWIFAAHWQTHENQTAQILGAAFLSLFFIEI
jgi:hypothetical protein